MTIRATHQFPIDLAGSGDYAFDAAAPRTQYEDVDGKIVKLGASTVNSGNGDSPRYRGIEVQIASNAANNATGSLRVYLARNGGLTPEQSGAGKDYDMLLLGTLAYTIGATVGLDDAGTVPTTYRLADTFSWTAATTGTDPLGAADYVSTGFASSQTPTVYSPANGMAACLLIPDAANRDVVFDTNVASGTTVRVICALWT